MMKILLASKVRRTEAPAYIFISPTDGDGIVR